MNRIDELERRLDAASNACTDKNCSCSGFVDMWDVAKDYHALCRELAAGQEWRDISTAPKDGTVVLVFNKEWGVTQQNVACWEEEFDCWCHAYKPLRPAPTYWMPLLPTPTEGKL